VVSVHLPACLMRRLSAALSAGSDSSCLRKTDLRLWLRSCCFCLGLAPDPFSGCVALLLLQVCACLTLACLLSWFRLAADHALPMSACVIPTITIVLDI